MSNHYDVIQARGQDIRTSNNGGTIENLLIDLTTGGSIILRANSHNATIRNIGFSGQHRGSGFVIMIGGAGDASGTVTLENIYVGDGTSKAGSSFVHGPGCMFVHSGSSSANVVIRDVNVRGWTNNGMYFANARSARWENCYTVNCGVSHYRCSNGEMHGCVGYNDSGQRYGTGSGSERFGRCTWLWGGRLDVHNSHIAQGPAGLNAHEATSNRGTGTIVHHSGGLSGSTSAGVQVRSGVGSPNLNPPDSVPMTAGAAASGESGGGEPPPPPGEDRPWEDDYDVTNIYEVENTSSDHVDYFLQVQDNDSFEHIDYEDAIIDPDCQTAFDDKAAGRIEPGDTHCVGFDAEMADVTIEPEGAAEARVNEQSSSLEWYPRPEADGDGWKVVEELIPECPSVDVEPDPPPEPPSTDYDFRATTQVVLSDVSDAQIDNEQYADEQEDGSWLAGGNISDDVQAFEVQGGGDITHFTVADSVDTATWYWEGQEFDPTDYPPVEDWDPSDPGAPDPPINVTATDTTEFSITIEWAYTDDSNLDGFNIYLDGAFQYDVDPSTRQTTVSDLEPGTNYTLGVSAVDQQGRESLRSETDATTDPDGEPPPEPDPDEPIEPSNFRVITDETWADLSWEYLASHDNLAGFNIYLDSSLQFQVPPDERQAMVEDLTPETTYEFGISAENDEGLESDMVTQTATTQPERDDIDITGWMEGQYELITSEGDIDHEFPDQSVDLDENTSYEYRIHATDRLGSLGWAGSARSFTTGSRDPGAPEPEPNVLDDFSHQNISDWYRSATAGARSEDEYAISHFWSSEGSYSAYNETNAPGVILSDGDQRRPEVGDTIRFDIQSGMSSQQATQAQRFRFVFGATSNTNYFDTYIDVASQQVYAFERTGSTSWTTLGQGSTSVIMDQVPFYGEIDWIEEDEFTLEFFDLGTGNSLSNRIRARASSHSASSGDFGFAMRSDHGDVWWADNFRVV